MKTCQNPQCKMSGIPDEAEFCPKCGTRLSQSFLFEGKGEASDLEGFLWVDIRQCKRIRGLGWNGKYEYEPGLPQGFTGFYAVFDEERKIQIRVENGKIDAIFISTKDPYNQNEYQVNFHKKTNGSEQESYFILGKNGIIISSKNDYERADIVLDTEALKLFYLYDKEFQDFFGISFEELMEHAEDQTEIKDSDDGIKETLKEQSEQKSTSDKVERIIASIIFVGLMILGFLMKEGVI